MSNGIGCERTCCFTDVPLNRMESVAAIRNVRRTYVLAGGQQIFHALRNQSAKRNLKRERAYIYVVRPACRRMQIDPIAPDPYGILETYRVHTPIPAVYATGTPKGLVFILSGEILIEKHDRGGDTQYMSLQWDNRELLVFPRDLSERCVECGLPSERSSLAEAGEQGHD